MQIQIYRTNSSSYQDSQFFKREKEELESIPGVKYLKSLTEANENDPFVLISNTHTEPTELPLTLLDKTVLMIHPNSGYDNFPKNFVDSVDFPIIVGNPIRSNAVAEYTLSSIFHKFTPIKNHSHWSNDRKWDRNLLRDQKVLILGYGEIGKLIYQSLLPLCSEVQVFDPFVKASDKNVFKNLSDNLVKDKNIVVVAASLTNSSRSLVDQNFLKNISSSAMIINAARGEIINEEDLINWLKKNEKASAYLDVFNQEPFSPGYMLDMENVNKTSHIAGVYDDLNEDIVKFEKRIITDFIQSQGEMDKFLDMNKSIVLTGKSINYL